MSTFIPIRLLGTSFSLKTEEDPEYLQMIIDSFESKLEDIKAKIGVSDPLKLSILTGIIVSEELHKERLSKGTSYTGEEQEIEKLTLNLIKSIDSVL